MTSLFDQHFAAQVNGASVRPAVLIESTNVIPHTQKKCKKKWMKWVNGMEITWQHVCEFANSDRDYAVWIICLFANTCALMAMCVFSGHSPWFMDRFVRVWCLIQIWIWDKLAINWEKWKATGESFTVSKYVCCSLHLDLKFVKWNH